MNDVMTRPPHWLDQHGHGEMAWPTGWVIERYTVQVPVVGAGEPTCAPDGTGTETIAAQAECESIGCGL
ncbi:hypothetical protein ACFXHA_33100 [Nocardia sp. NPDC059240]|uniref:hypothetical protein n=1 Tax=Nocardia sp. NPDC059240 TaxID=3346786 RepID=UPI0036848EB8